MEVLIHERMREVLLRKCNEKHVAMAVNCFKVFTNNIAIVARLFTFYFSSH